MRVTCVDNAKRKICINTTKRETVDDSLPRGAVARKRQDRHTLQEESESEKVCVCE